MASALSSSQTHSLEERLRRDLQPSPVLVEQARKRAESVQNRIASTFVMISQNRADAKHQVVADLQWRTVQEEDSQNQELLDLSHQILELTKAVHESTTAGSGGASGSRRRPAG
jgi:hypothetical protein